MKETFRRLALSVPQIRRAIEGRDAQLRARDEEIVALKAQLTAREGFAPGHFYSVIPEVEEVRRTYKFDRQRRDLPGIDLRTEQQLAFFGRALEKYDDMPFPVEKDDSSLFYHRNGYFGFLDAFMLNAVMREFRPRRIVEVGSGFSSALMMEVNRLHLDLRTRLTFIDAYEIERLQARMRAAGSQDAKIVNARIQEVDVTIVDALEENDILFIDSSHVSKVGSDVNHIFFELLPRLRKGVLVHFHDIHYPFELHEAWILQLHFFWNESYLLRAFLQFNDSFEIVFFNDYFDRHFPQELARAKSFSGGGGSIWLRRTR